MKKTLMVVLLFVMLGTLAGCGNKDGKTTAETGGSREKEAEAAIMEQVSAEDEREAELVSLTDIDGTWFSLVCIKDGDNLFIEDGYLSEKDEKYIYQAFTKALVYSKKENGFFNAGWSREIAGKTIYVSISKQMKINKCAHWNSGARKIEGVDIHYLIEWD